MQNQEENSKEIKLEKKIKKLLQKSQQQEFAIKTYQEQLAIYLNNIDYYKDQVDKVSQIYKLIEGFNISLRVELDCYERGVKPSCSDFVRALDIKYGKVPRPDYVLQENWFLPLMN